MARADVIVIGGGLAGAAFALEVARGGGRVRLIERSRRPTLKVCGDFLSGEALDCLSHLGVSADHLGARPVKTLTLSAETKVADVPLPFSAAGLSRLSLDETLLALATAAGAEVVRGVTVTGLRCEDRAAVVSTADSSHRAAAVVLATGKHDLRGWQRRRGSVTAFKMQFRLSRNAQADLTDRVMLAVFDGGHIGACLVESGLATLCWQIDTKRLKDYGHAWQRQLAGVAHRTPVIGDLLDRAEPIQSRPAAVSSLPFGYVRYESMADHVYPIGDQLAVIPSFTGDGTAIALSSGVHAARAFLANKPASACQAAFARAIRRQFLVASATSPLMRSHLGRMIGIRAVSAAPGIAAALAHTTRLATHSLIGGGRMSW